MSKAAALLTSITDEMRARLASRTVAQPDGCWLWTGSLTRGYGNLTIRGATVLAHRLSYAIYVGPLDASLKLDHLCRNPRCVNPAHLEQVSQRINLLRGFGFSGRNARKTHCHRGHPFDEVNTIVLPSPPDRVYRQCRTCKRITDHERWLKTLAKRGVAS